MPDQKSHPTKHIFQSTALSAPEVRLKTVDDRDLDQILDRAHSRSEGKLRQPPLLPFSRDILLRLIQVIQEI